MLPSTARLALEDATIVDGLTTEGTVLGARVAAAERDTSVSALVKDFLDQLASHETESERLKRKELEIRSQITAFSASDKLSRDELHSRER